MFQQEGRKAAGADAAHEPAGFIDVALHCLAGLLHQGSGEGSGGEVERFRLGDQNRRLSDPFAFHVMGKLQAMDHVQAAAGERLGGQHGGDGRGGVEDGTGIAQQAVDIGVAEELSGQERSAGRAV